MLLSMLTGLMIGTSYIPFPPWAAFFGMIPLWWCWVKNPSPRKIFITGWIAQFCLTAIGFHWVAYTAHEFGMLPSWASGIVLVLFCSIASLHIPASGLLWWVVFSRGSRPQSWQSLLGLGVCMGLMETLWPMIFPWNMAYPFLAVGAQFTQYADVFGFQGLSSLIWITNSCLLTFGIGLRPHGWRFAPWLLMPVVFWTSLEVTGSFRALPWRDTDRTATFQIVQANIGNLEKHYAHWGRGFRGQIVKEYLDLSNSLQGRVDFMLWPETAYPDMLDNLEPDSQQHQLLRDFLRSKGTTLLTGGYSRGNSTSQEYNAFFALNSEGWPITPPYRKSILLAFGEYFPGGDWFPVLYRWFPTVARFEKGPGPTVLDVQGVRMGPQICYEGLYPDFARQQADREAQILVNVTNDSWFGRDFEPYQHLHMTLARALENRRPLIRSTNTGISTAILADGTILPFSPILEPWTGVLELKYHSEPVRTFFTTWAPVLSVIPWLTLILLALLNKKARPES